VYVITGLCSLSSKYYIVLFFFFLFTTWEGNKKDLKENSTDPASPCALSAYWPLKEYIR